MESFRQTLKELEELNNEINESRLAKMDWIKLGLFKKKYKKFKKNYLEYSFHGSRTNNITVIKFYKVLIRFVKFEHSLKNNNCDFNILKSLFR